MRILMVNKFLYPRGGAETYFLKIGKYFSEHGHDVQYFGMYDEKNTVFNSLNLYTGNMDFHSGGLRRLTYPFKIIYSFEAYKKMNKLIKDFKPDVIHMNNINFQLTPSIIDAAKKNGVPVVQTVHDCQMICPNHLLFDIHSKKICEKCLGGSKTACIKNKCIHGSTAKSIIGYLESILYKYKGTYRLVDKYICPSSFLEGKLLTDSTFSGKTQVIHNFIEQNTNDVCYKKKDYVLFFGRLSEEKGLDIFLRSCKKLPHITFKIAGTGPLEGDCYGIDNVEYVGFKTGKDLDKLIAEAKFTVYPSICYENCPLSIQESISLGTPVVTTGWGGMKELVDDGKTGVWVNPINTENLTECIERLYNSDSVLQEMYSECKRKRETMITIEDYCKEIADIYRSVINNHK